MEEVIPVELGGILAVGAVNHVAPRHFGRDGIAAAGGGAALAAHGADHGFDGNRMIPVCVQPIHSHSVHGPVYHYVIGGGTGGCLCVWQAGAQRGQGKQEGQYEAFCSFTHHVSILLRTHFSHSKVPR